MSDFNVPGSRPKKTRWNFGNRPTWRHTGGERSREPCGGLSQRGSGTEKQDLGARLYTRHFTLDPGMNHPNANKHVRNWYAEPANKQQGPHPATLGALEAHGIECRVRLHFTSRERLRACRVESVACACKSYKSCAQAGKRDPNVRQVGDSFLPSLRKPKNNHTIHVILYYTIILHYARL